MIILLGFMSCEKKKYPESGVENEAVFYLKGNVNYRPLSIIAGENDYYMYSSYKLDANNVYSFAGQLRQINCTDCRNTLEVRFRDRKASVNGVPGPVDSSLHSGFYRFIDKTAGGSYNVTFQGSSRSPGNHTVRWDFGDGSSSAAQNPSHDYTRPGKYNVCLSISDENGCKGSVCNVISVGDNSCVASVNAAPEGDRSVRFSATVLGQGPFRYLWRFGDGDTSNQGTPLHVYDYDGSYPVTLRVISANNDTAISNYNVVTKKDSYSCMPNTRVLDIAKSAQPLFSEVILTWTDSDGTVYTSDQTWQPADAHFEVIKVEDYTVNENMQRTKKVHVRFSCFMSNGKRSIPFTNAEAVICVAVP